MTSTLFTDTLSVKRLLVSANHQRTYQAVASIACMIQPLDDKAAAFAGTAFGKGYKAYAAVDSDVTEGDRATDQNGRVFNVIGTKLRPYGGLSHVEVILNEDRAR